MNPANFRSATLLINPAFQSLTPNEAASLLSSGKVRTFKEGEVLMRINLEGNSMIIITNGEVSIQRGKIQLATLGVGETIGRDGTGLTRHLVRRQPLPWVGLDRDTSTFV